jgi:diguanylate cyclase (GGDEF)-like protein
LELDSELDLSPEDVEQIRSSVQRSHDHLQELRLEKETYEREIELDEQGIVTAKAIQGFPGSRILVIDDDDVLRNFLVGRLQIDGYEVDEAKDVDSAQRLLRETAYDLITLDLMMYPSTGYDLFEYLKEDPSLKWIPLVVLSGRDDVKDKVRCFYLGADDFVIKPFQYEELSARIFSLLKRTKNFEQMAFRDPLTGVYNRRYFDHQIQVELQRIQRFPAPLSIAFIDIDRFKSINDTHGHHIGDLVLQGLAHLLQTCMRTTDILARFGGEEFVAVLPNTNGEHAVRRLEAIRQKTHEGPVVTHEGQEFFITFSAGIAEWKAGLEPDRWIRQADAAMYHAKQQGRDRVLVHNTGMLSEPECETVQPAARKTIVVADDDIILRSILVSKLQHLEADVVEASDGNEAWLALTSQEKVDLCILDAVMPGEDGYAVLQRMKASPAFAKTKVLFMSGTTKEEDEAKVSPFGTDDFMRKPFSLVDLETRVKQLLES